MWCTDVTVDGHPAYRAASPNNPRSSQCEFITKFLFVVVDNYYNNNDNISQWWPYLLICLKVRMRDRWDDCVASSWPLSLSFDCETSVSHRTGHARSWSTGKKLLVIWLLGPSELNCPVNQPGRFYYETFRLRMTGKPLDWGRLCVDCIIQLRDPVGGDVFSSSAVPVEPSTVQLTVVLNLHVPALECSAAETWECPDDKTTSGGPGFFRGQGGSCDRWATLICTFATFEGTIEFAE